MPRWAPDTHILGAGRHWPAGAANISFWTVKRTASGSGRPRKADAEARAVQLAGQKTYPKAILRYRNDSTVGLMNVGDLPALDEKSYQLWLWWMLAASVTVARYL